MRLFKKKEMQEEIARVDSSENAIANREVEGLTQRQEIFAS